LAPKSRFESFGDHRQAHRRCRGGIGRSRGASPPRRSRSRDSTARSANARGALRASQGRDRTSGYSALMFAALMIGHHLSWLENLPSLLNDHSLAPTIAPAAHLRETRLRGWDGRIRTQKCRRKLSVEKSRGFAGIQPNSGFGDYRVSSPCSVGWVST